MKLVAVLDRIGEAVEHWEQVGGGLLGGDRDEFLGKLYATSRGTGVVELFDNLVFGGNRLVAENVTFGLLGGHGNPRILRDLLLGRGPPLLESFLAQDLLEDDLKIDCRRGLVGEGGKSLHNQLDRLVVDQLGDLLRFDLLANEEVFGWQNVERGDAECRIHPVFCLALEVDHQLLVRFIIFLDLTEPPAPVDAIGAWLHGLQLGFGRLERRVFGDERVNGFRIHECDAADVKR